MLSPRSSDSQRVETFRQCTQPEYSIAECSSNIGRYKIGCEAIWARDQCMVSPGSLIGEGLPAVFSKDQYPTSQGCRAFTYDHKIA